MHKPRSSYRSYLIRCWWADNDGHPVWRVAVQEPGSETQLHFASLAELCAWLTAQLEGKEDNEGEDKEQPLCN